MLVVFVVVVFMLLVLSASVLVVAYVAFPHRGKTLPGAPRVGEAMSQAALWSRSKSLNSDRDADDARDPRPASNR